jgi:hypothetical protein
MPAAHSQQRTRSSGKADWLYNKTARSARRARRSGPAALRTGDHPVCATKSNKPKKTANTKDVKITNRFGIESYLLR